jgi:protein-L-isoaspartate(D-aspartate) O-methyltransferase
MNMPLNTSANINDAVEQARYNMIEQQIRPWNVLDTNVLDLLMQLPREDFVPPAYKTMAFMDMAIPLLGQPEQDLRLGQCMLPPRIEARMLQDLQIQPTDRVLEIGTGSGYMAALLAKQAQHVHTLEINPAIADMARDNLQNAGIYNVDVRTQDASQTLPAGPFDVIVLSGSVASIPEGLTDLLAASGRLAAIVGQEPVMRFTLVQRSSEGLQTTTPWDTTAPRLLHFPEPSRFTF